MAAPAMSGDKPASSDGEDRKIAVFAALLWIAILLFHAGKALGYNPLVIPDEYTYASDIRHRPFSEALIPNYLYYAVFSLTSLFGSRFLDAGRVLNAVIFMLSTPFVYLVSRQVATWRTSLFLALVTAIWPISIHTAYFMPESIYFTCFWIFAWLFLSCGQLGHFRQGLVAGALIGLLSLLKMHGVFLLPGFALFTFATTSWEGLKPYARKIALAGIASAGSFALTRFGLGFLFAGTQGLRLFGSEYGGLTREGWDTIRTLSFLGHSLYALLGNLMALCVITALPLTLSLHFPKRMSAVLAASGDPPGFSAATFRLVLNGTTVKLPVFPAKARTVFADGQSDTIKIVWEDAPDLPINPWESLAASAPRLSLTAPDEK
jgi:phosphoglycerol transferase